MKNIAYLTKTFQTNFELVYLPDILNQKALKLIGSFEQNIHRKPSKKKGIVKIALGPALIKVYFLEYILLI